ncbi:DNA mismatch repair protein, MutS family [Desulfitobacterium dichloroeliminans LMG P-21439]|uniref:Endonuclease MutS2 n=1 Tax=Desulfitobacterium dichloroeliminans (strain LMG P-21439 / DCA1) TaxID=871963 RepID=L0F480_DESDL|nr:endonuclease MutS2 [Desulfitobacterium dichloroeliminans]AGA67743.1 DNA mismatch repair protein, MutS family [Desulfitobacterium dichloroeliminans LMG P-21439]
MVIEERVIRKLDFDKILEGLAQLCLLPRAQELAKDMKPFAHLDLVREALEETGEAKSILRVNPLFSVRGAKEIRPLLERCLRGGTLTPDELLQIRDTLKAARYVKQSLLEGKVETPHLKGIMESVLLPKGIEEEISRCITEDGQVADQASPLLTELRRGIGRLQSRIRETLEGIIRNPSYQKILQDPIITQRSERYVVPVKQEYRQAFQGIVHDQSASGATLFIEPMTVVNLGNELREVILKEQREVQRILLLLSARVEGEVEAIAETHEALARVDFILAKAHLSEGMNAGAPILTDKQEISLVQARHPLLTGKVVPLTIELGTRFDTVVVTGPNTGGKTVALKTLGLLAAMAQCGLHIPAESDSRVGVFTQIFADIGDEQSVEQSLSTFSGHMRNIVEIVEKADERSLILLDEVGAGTDPTEGSALAMAIIAQLHERGSRIVATTHYGALKNFAYNTPRVENASVEFDSETLRPTYRLLIGIPGKSNAFYIAGRLGLPEEVLVRARTYVTEREMQVADLIENLEDTQREIDFEKRRAREERQIIEIESLGLKEKSQKLEDEYQGLMAKAKDQATEIVREARREAERLIDELKLALKEDRKDQQAVDRARQGIRKLSSRVGTSDSQPRASEGVNPEDLKLGQMVYMTKLRQKGQVLKLPNSSGEILVQAGVIKLNVPLSEIRLEKEEKPTRSTRSVISQRKGDMKKAETLRTEIDLRGMMVEEASFELDKYLDDAVLTGVGQVYVIHGKGTGALRNGIQEFLRGHHHVKSFRIGQHGEGDLGVTVVELR